MRKYAPGLSLVLAIVLCVSLISSREANAASYYDWLSSAPQGTLVTARAYRDFSSEIEPDINANNPDNRDRPPVYDAAEQAARWLLPSTANCISNRDQLRRPFGEQLSSGNALFYWEHKFSDHNWTADAGAGDLQTWKAFQLSDGGKLGFEIRFRFSHASNPDVAKVDFRTYTSSGFDGNDNLDPEVAFYAGRDRWTRFWVYMDFEARRATAWVADEFRAPVKVLEHQFSNMGAVSEFWFEYNTSQDNSGPEDLAIWGRNLVVLKNVGNPNTLVSQGAAETDPRPQPPVLEDQ